MIFSTKNDFSSGNYNIYTLKIIYGINDKLVSYVVLAKMIRKCFKTYDLYGYIKKCTVVFNYEMTNRRNIQYVTSKNFLNIKSIISYTYKCKTSDSLLKRRKRRIISWQEATWGRHLSHVPLYQSVNT